MAINEIPEFVDISNHGEKLLREYSRKLEVEEEKIELVNEIMATVTSVMEKHNVREQAINWDREGVKLENGKAKLPNGMELVVKELIKDNSIGSLLLEERFGGFGFNNTLISPILQLITEYDLALSIMTLSGLGIMSTLTRFYKEAFEGPLKRMAAGDHIAYVAFTEPQAGSNLKAIKSTSELVGDEYVLNGTKLYISNGGIASAGIFLANNIVDGKVQGTNAFFIEGTDGITTLRLEEKSGLKASPTAQLEFENVTVPKEHLIGDVGTGYERVIERLMGMRVSVGFQGLAACQRAYKLCYDYANVREQFGRPIIQFPDIQRKLNMMSEQIPKLQEMAYASAFALDLNNMMVDKNYRITEKNIPNTKIGKNIPQGIKNKLIHYYVSSAKLYAAEITNYQMYDAQQVFGGLGFISEMEVNKISRDIRVLSIFDGTSEIHKFLVNRAHKYIPKIDNFSTPLSNYESITPYEKMLFARFPDLEGKF